MITREQSVAIARSYIGTPYRLGGRVKGAGVDCATLLAEWGVECGIFTREQTPLYSHDWFCNTTEDRYLFEIMRHAHKTLESVCRGGIEAKPGCLVLFKVVRSKLFNHGGIVTQWPMIVHAIDPCVREHNAISHYMTGHTEMAIFDPWDGESL